jgi:hypothetical protein
MKPGIAFVLIAKNDASRIERCLLSVKSVVQEMIVLDTGSTDGTQYIARNLGARVSEREWPNDFAQALNWVFDLVEHEWTFRLDSDEWLLPGSAAKLLALAKRQDIFAASIIREDYIEDGRFAETESLRFWRTDPEMRMVGIVHEQFLHSTLDKVARGRQLIQSEVRVGHDGYFLAALPVKHERNLMLVERELAVRPGNLYYESERVRIKVLLAQPDAESALQELIEKLMTYADQDTPPSYMVTGPLTLALDRMPDDRLNEARTTDILRLARGWCWNDPAVTYAAAKTFIRRKDLRSAFDALMDLERMSTTGEYQRSGFNHPSMLEESLWQNLALVAHQLGRKDVAARNYESLLRWDPENALARQNLPLLLKT